MPTETESQIVLPPAPEPPRPRNAYLGKDSVVWYENKTSPEYEKGWAIIAGHSTESSCPHGFIRRVAELASDCEKVWKRVHEQERKRYEQMSEMEYSRRSGKIAEIRSKMNNELLQSNNEAEKDFLRAALKMLAEKEHRMQTNSIYGIAAMQAFEEGKEN